LSDLNSEIHPDIDKIGIDEIKKAFEAKDRAIARLPLV